MKNDLTYMLRCMVCLFSYKLRASTNNNKWRKSFTKFLTKNLPKSVFSEIRVRTWVQVVSRQKKNRPLIGRPDRLANQKPVSLAGNCLSSCLDSDLLTRLTRKILTTRGNLSIFCMFFIVEWGPTHWRRVRNWSIWTNSTRNVGKKLQWQWCDVETDVKNILST